ncbi:unnamed protein product [Brachionus calyciflorus]|uniref:Uncharacterized protein n=1 Tax=Brachionus calyciflorus TaxID=104777 RepID=A0A814AGQ6_9BILA|nr:unnamed protein product [Brachionus calyciflorus]
MELASSQLGANLKIVIYEDNLEFSLDVPKRCAYYVMDVDKNHIDESYINVPSGEDLKSSAKKSLSESIKNISERFNSHEGEGLALPPNITKNNSNECAKSELDLFKTPSTNTSIVSDGWFEINPTSLLSVGSRIEFRYEGDVAGRFHTIESDGDAYFVANSRFVKHSNPQTNKTFIGVYATDELPFIKSYPCGFILNTADRLHEGMH